MLKNKWTFVTMYYDLSNYNKERTNEFYINCFKNYKKLDVNLVVVTDKKTKLLLEPYSPQNIHYILIEMNDLPLMKLLPTIEDNNRRYLYTSNNRGTPIYQLIVHSKIEAIIQTEKTNPFNSDIFCWVDFAYYRPEHGYVDYTLEQLNNSLLRIQNSNIYNENTVHVGIINYSDTLLHHTKEQTCSFTSMSNICAGMLFGNIKAFTELYHLINIVFRHNIINLNLPYHTEETNLRCCYNLQPSLFTLYPTDYFKNPFDILYNCKHLHTSTKYLIPSLIRNKQHKTTKNIIEHLLVSHSFGNIKLSQDNLIKYDDFLSGRLTETKSKWTFVTMYFDIYNKSPRHTKSIDFYLEEIKKIIQLDINIIMFVDENVYDKFSIYQSDKFKCVSYNIEDLPLMKYLETIKNNNDDSLYKDHRFTPEYRLITSSKNFIVNRAIEMDVYGSDIFAWIDIGFCRENINMDDFSINSFKRHLQLVMNTTDIHYNTNTVHLSLHGWYPKIKYDKYETFYDGQVLKTIPAGFYYGDKKSMKEFNTLLDDLIQDHIDKSSFFLEEWLYFYCLLKRPELFSVSVADYYMNFHNAVFLSHTLHLTENVIDKLLEDNQYKFAKELIHKLCIAEALSKIIVPENTRKRYMLSLIPEVTGGSYCL